jgi:phosphatidylglycerophosphatase A
VKAVVRSLAWAIATWFGCGLAPIAPGTVGTLGAIPVYWLSVRAGPTVVAGVAVLVTLVGVWAAFAVSRELDIKDPSLVVVDEVAGMLVTMFPASSFSWPTVATGFVLFRLLDIAKPWPIRALEKLPGGWGIVLDDIAAGALAAAALAALRAARVLP